MKKIFITGVDTDIGKTYVSIGLAISQSKIQKTGYFKPFQSGAYEEQGILKAPDIVELSKYSNVKSGYSYLLKGEVSPYLASKLSNTKIDINKVVNDINDFSSNLDLTIIEGAGGFYCPITDNILFADFIKKLNIETIIVTNPNLGRLNHTLMTLDCAKKYEINVKGLIINNVSNNPTLSEKYFIDELKAFSDVKILAQIPKMKEFNHDNIFNIFKNIIL